MKSKLRCLQVRKGTEMPSKCELQKCQSIKDIFTKNAKLGQLRLRLSVVMLN
jgi:hypothetical protein